MPGDWHLLASVESDQVRVIELEQCRLKIISLIVRRSVQVRRVDGVL